MSRVVCCAGHQLGHVARNCPCLQFPPGDKSNGTDAPTWVPPRLPQMGGEETTESSMRANLCLHTKVQSEGKSSREAVVNVWLKEAPYANIDCYVGTGAAMNVFKAENVPPRLLNNAEVLGVGLSGKHVTSSRETRAIAMRIGGQLHIVASVLVS